jgi:hypothetical protein
MSAIFRMLKSIGLGKTEEDSKPPEIESEPEKHALIIRFVYGLSTSNQFDELAETLYEAFLEYEPAEYDGHEIAMDLSDGMFFFYGPDADELLKLASPILLKYEFMKGAECIRRYGDVENDQALTVTTLLGRLPS